MHIKQLFITLSICAVCTIVTSCSQCTAQHDPSGDIAMYDQESNWANAPAPTLTEAGKIPPKKTEDGAKPTDPVSMAYNTYCAACHGPDGAAAGAAAMAMSPRPRNLTDAKWQANVADARIYKVIKDGGASVGLSASMAPWGAVLNDELINGLVAKIRDFKK